MKKLLAFLLVLSMLLAMIVIPVSANEGAKSVTATGATMTKTYNFSDEEIDERVESVKIGENTYQVIWTPHDLINLNVGTTNGYYYFILGKDLDFKGIDLTPVSKNSQVSVFGKGDKWFKYTFDGNGCTLKNININFTVEGAGLFPTANYCNNTVKNLTINATASLNAQKTGILFGNVAHANTTKITIDNVAVNADITSSASNTGAFLAYNAGANGATISNCTFNANVDANAQGFGGYVGVSGKPVSFTNCIVNGNIDFLGAGVHCGGFIGQNGAATASFNNCALDANMVSGNNRQAGYIGTVQQATTITFEDCSAKGTLYQKGTKWFSGYVGGVQTSATLNFTDCVSDVNIIANGGAATSGFVGGMNSNAAAKFNFTNCSFTGTIAGDRKAAAFIGDNDAKMASTTVVFDNCKSEGKILTVGNGSYAEPFLATSAVKSCTIKDNCTVADQATNYVNYVEDRMNSGEGTYAIRTAQVAAGVPEKMTVAGTEYNLLFGQNLETEIKATLGSIPVYKLTTAKGATVYSNNAELGVLEAPADGGARVHYQLKTSDETKSFRALIDVSEAYLGEITSMKLTVAFKTSDTTSKVLTVENEAIEMFYAVVADGDIYQTADGRVLLAVSVEGITADWTGDVKIELVTTGSANAVAAYSVTSVSNAFGG